MRSRGRRALVVVGTDRTSEAGVGACLALSLAGAVALGCVAGGHADERVAAAPTARADPARLRQHVAALVAHAPRDFAHPEGLDRAAAWIAAALREHSPEVTTQPFEVGGRTYRNVVARFGPAGRERIVVGAHYDAAGALPAADDDASGVAGLLELARLLAADPPRFPVELVAYALEEPPTFATSEMGSAVHASALARQGVQVRLMIALEMIGYFTDAKNTQDFPAPGLGLIYPTTGDFIAVVGKVGQGGAVRRVRDAMRAASPLGVESITAPASMAGVGLSDHRSYWDRWDAVMVTDTAFFRNPNYHRETDTPETLDYARMAQVVTGVHAAVRAVAARR